MVRISTLETRFKATGADSSAFATATGPSDGVLAARTGAPLDFPGLSHLDILLNNVILLLNFCGAEGLYLLESVLFLAPRLHAWQLHGHAVGDLGAQIVCLAIHAKAVPAGEAEEIFCPVRLVAHIAEGSSFYRIRSPIHEVFVEFGD